MVVRIEAGAVDGCVEISVVDRGIGVPVAERARIFEKFYRVDCRRASEVGGSGIGLSLVKHIVEAHEGEVRVKSEPGGGSRFTVALPMAPLVRPQVAPSSARSIA